MTANDGDQDEKKRLTGKQQQAALCLARGLTIKKTADECKCAPITIERWKRLDPFMEAVRQAEDELFNDHLRTLKKTAGAAIATLIRNMEGKVSAYVQVQAASKLLDLSIELHKMSELEARIAELEALLQERDGTR